MGTISKKQRSRSRLLSIEPGRGAVYPFPGDAPLRAHPCGACLAAIQASNTPGKGYTTPRPGLGQGIESHEWHGATRTAGSPRRIIRFRAECSARIGVDCTGMCNRGKTIQDVLFAGPVGRAEQEGSRRRRPQAPFARPYPGGRRRGFVRTADPVFPNRGLRRSY